MLKSYKQLSRWYGALEPENGAAEDRSDSRGVPASSGRAAQTGVPDPRPERIPGDEDSAQSGPEDIPAALPAQHSEFRGGWSDWVVTDHAPGPEDDHIVSNTDLGELPWAVEEPDDRARSRPIVPHRAAGARSAVRRGRLLLVVIAAVLVLAVAVVCVVVLSRSASDAAAAPRQSPSVQLTAGGARASGNPLAAGACPTERDDVIVRSAEAGGTNSGPDVVLLFQYAYYVERSGARARAAVAPDAAVPPARIIQRGIDTVPAETTHCVRIVTISDNRYSVEVTEYRPGGAPATYNKQTVTTAVIDGRTLITGIAAG
ncbi:hypothetical protein ACL02S_04325 [Nocardia sp. 004]|uniref:hypothetical protein n=1 Tax=Nocardia sp. 004 TaxID=3385978 RepID=UPI0039A39A6B